MQDARLTRSAFWDRAGKDRAFPCHADNDTNSRRPARSSGRLSLVRADLVASVRGPIHANRARVPGILRPTYSRENPPLPPPTPTR